MLQSNHKAKGAAEMYLQILKKDLKRKRAMNVILLVFIILASMFMSWAAIQYKKLTAEYLALTDSDKGG